VKPLRPVALALLTFATSATAAAAQPDVKALIRQSVENYDRAWRAGMQWGHLQEDVTCSDGKKEIEVSEVIPLEGTPYERLISKNGQPLSADERRKEDQKYEKALRQRKAESPEERRARLDKYEKERGFIRELPEAYDFRLVGDEVVDGRPSWVVTLTPRPGFVPTTPHADLLKHIEGKLWIDKQDLQWARAEAHVIDTISIGLILARIGAGAHITLDMDRIAQGFWAPHEITINGEARVLMVHTKNLDEHLTFTEYRLGTHLGGAEVAAKATTAAKSFH
jgi:hypothetical protein